MTKTFRAVLIDPERCTIEVHKVSGTMAAADTHRLLDCDSLDHFRIADHDSTWDYAWVDDTGLSRGQPIDAFLFSTRVDPIAGRCLLIGVDKNTGETTDAKFPVETLRAVIEWLGKIVPEVTWDHTDTGSRAIVTYARVKATERTDNG